MDGPSQGPFRIVERKRSDDRPPKWREKPYYTVIDPNCKEVWIPCTRSEYCVSEWRKLNVAYAIGRQDGEQDIERGDPRPET